MGNIYVVCVSWNSELCLTKAFIDLEKAKRNLRSEFVDTLEYLYEIEDDVDRPTAEELKHFIKTGEYSKITKDGWKIEIDEDFSFAGISSDYISYVFSIKETEVED